MKSFIILSFLIVATFGFVRKPLSPQSRIVGGENAEIVNFEYQVSVAIFDIHICGGSVIDKRWILTAAHCVSRIKESWLKFRAGSTSYKEGGQIFYAVLIFIHPEYDENNGDYDIALVLVDKDLSGTNIVPISLPKFSKDLKSGQSGIVSGWGVTNQEVSSISKVLQYVNVNVIDREVCNITLKRFGGIRKMSFCAAAPEKDSCQGDTGGPMVINGVQEGIVSWGIGCANKNYPRVYTRVSDYFIRTWIDNLTGV